MSLFTNISHKHILINIIHKNFIQELRDYKYANVITYKSLLTILSQMDGYYYPENQTCNVLLLSDKDLKQLCQSVSESITF